MNCKLILQREDEFIQLLVCPAEEMPCLAVREGVGDVSVGQAHPGGLGPRPEPGEVDQRQFGSHLRSSGVLFELRYISKGRMFEYKTNVFRRRVHGGRGGLSKTTLGLIAFWRDDLVKM